MKNISEAEFEVMRILWDNGEATSIQIIDKLLVSTKWNRNTIKTLINRLANKNIIKAKKEDGKLYVYRPLISEQDYKNTESKGFIEKLYKGSIRNMLYNFVETDKLSKQDLKELIELIEKEEE